MKKLFLLLATVSMIFTACENSGVADLPQPLIDIIGGSESMSLNFPSDGVLEKNVTFKSNYDWSVTTSDEWIKISPKSGKAGEECQVTVSLDPNDTYDVRKGEISISVQGLSIDLPVSQQPKNGLMLSNSEMSLPQSGGAFDVAVLSNVDFDYEIKAEWIKAVEGRALAENKVRFEAEANPATDKRTGEILFEGEGLTATLTVTQSQTNVITLSTSTVEINEEGGTFSVDVLANVEYEVAIADDCDWITLMDSRAMTESTLNFSVSENKSDETRSATISISGDGVEEKITVKQAYKVVANNNTILYTSSDGKVITPSYTDLFGANIISNTYENGQGVIKFDAPVTSIGNLAFLGRTSLTSVTIPESVTTIGSSAFHDCKSLTSITIPNGVTSIGESAFRECASLTSITIPDSVTLIDGNAFYHCTSLESITVGSGVTSIGSNAFYGCTGELILNCSRLGLYKGQFTKLTIGDSVTSIGDYVFSDCTSLTSVIIGNSVTEIGTYAFRRCTSLTSVTIGNSVTSIEYEAFAYCDSLTNINFPDSPNGVISIGEAAFAVCKSLESLTIPSSVTSIGERAFEQCTSLTNVTIDDGDTSIGERAFYDCTSLTNITIGKGTKEFMFNVFKNCNIKKVYYKSDISNWCNLYFDSIESTPIRGVSELYIDGQLVEDVVLPEGLTHIRHFAFANYTKLKSVKFPTSLISIDDGVFSGCTSLTDIIFPESLVTLGGGSCVTPNYDQGGFSMVGNGPAASMYPDIWGAFYGCVGIKTITIPENVTSINGKVFEGCSSLETIYSPSTTAPTLKGSPFPATLKEIKVPSSAYVDYVSSWSEYASIISADGTGDDSSSDSNDRVIYYTTSDNNPIKLHSNATGAYYNKNYFGAKPILNTYENGQGRIIFDGPVTRFGHMSYNPFESCTTLTSITIPDSVTEIGYSVFYNCKSLTRVNISNLSAWFKIDFGNYSANPLYYGAKLYLNGNELTDITIPSDITEIKNYAFYKYKSLTSVNIPNSVTSIGKYAFGECTSLTSVNIPNGVTSIGEYAFGDCASLTSVNIPNSVTSIEKGLFDGCTLLTSITIPNSVTSIGEYAFGDCASLTSITIGSGVTSIGDKAFSGCKSLTSITIPDSVTEIRYNTFGGCTSLTSVTIPDGVTSIGKSAFYNCSSLTSITIPDGVTSIGSYAFYNCKSLTNITIGSGVTSIGDEAFYCAGGKLVVNSNILSNWFKAALITELVIGESVTNIGDKAFYDCESLTSVTLPKSVTSIGEDAFYDCKKMQYVFYGGELAQWCSIDMATDNSCPLYWSGTLLLNGNIPTGEITIPEGTKKIPVGTFRNNSLITKVIIPNGVTSIGSSAFYGCTSLTSITIPNSVTSIGGSAFYNCSSLTSITIPDGVTSIGSYAFYNCKSLTSITIGNSVTSIGYAAFYYCSSLTSVTIPDSVTSIGKEAFRYCNSLTSVYCKPTTPPSLGSSAFFGANSTTIFVPTSAVNLYKISSGWSSYADKIVGHEF